MRKSILMLLVALILLSIFCVVNVKSSNGINQTTEIINATLPWVSPSVYEQLNKSEWVNIGVSVFSYDSIDEIILSIPEGEFQLERKSYGDGFPSFIGNITTRGLSILANNANVNRVIYNIPTYVASNQTKPYIDPEILKAFENNQTWVKVIVELQDNSNIIIQGTKEERTNLSRQRKEWFSLETDKILANLSQNESKFVIKSSYGFHAEVTRQEFDKLADNSMIHALYLNAKISGSDVSNLLITENQIEIKESDTIKQESFIQKIINFFKSLFKWK